MLSVRRNGTCSISMSYIPRAPLPTPCHRWLQRTQLHVRTRPRTTSYAMEGAMCTRHQTGWATCLHRVQFQRAHLSKVSTSSGHHTPLTNIVSLQFFFARKTTWTHDSLPPHTICHDGARSPEVVDSVGACPRSSTDRRDAVVPSRHGRQRDMGLRARRPPEKGCQRGRLVLSDGKKSVSLVDKWTTGYWSSTETRCQRNR